ncbi:unnamed protein product, partial [Pleuronectes platessa]
QSPVSDGFGMPGGFDIKRVPQRSLYAGERRGFFGDPPSRLPWQVSNHTKLDRLSFVQSVASPTQLSRFLLDLERRENKGLAHWPPVVGPRLRPRKKSKAASPKGTHVSAGRICLAD